MIARLAISSLQSFTLLTAEISRVAARTAAGMGAQQPEPNLPRTRSVQQAQYRPPIVESSIPRSPDAPLDPYDNRKRDTSGLTSQQVDAQVQHAINNASAKATEALDGRAHKLYAHPNFPDRDMNILFKFEKGNDWTDEVSGDGIKESIKKKLVGNLHRMFGEAAPLPGGTAKQLDPAPSKELLVEGAPSVVQTRKTTPEN
mmetsp:Transcript_15475/g.26761  ORF Transcript_15475/g.26761 Transcript_15475/m.26761 type:complete len:201 (+) Transcript_15475:46-648(+)